MVMLNGGMSEYERYQPTTYPWSVISSITSFVCIFISFVSPYWLVNTLEGEEAQFLNLGLWQACFRNYKDYRYLYDRTYDGCYWTLDEEMHVIEDQMRRPFYVSVQTLFTLCFVLAIIATVLTVGIMLSDEAEKGLLKLTYLTLLTSFVFGFIAVIVFAVLGDSRDWMPHWDSNFLSWSFALGVAGVLLQLLAAVLLWVEYRIARRGDSSRNTHGMFGMDTKA